jgi:glycogen(starch) synthase
VADLAEKRTGRRPAFIPNPVDLTIFHPAAVATPSADRPWQLVASGRFVGWKGFANLIEAMGRLKDKIDVRLSIAGEGPEQENLVAQIQRLGLNERVRLCGRLEASQLGDLMRSGDLYVVPSIGLDACPVSALEAACVGLPLLLSNQVGLNDFMDKRDVVSYPATNIDELTTGLIQLHERRNETEWTDHIARHNRLRKTFSGESVAQQILDLLR